MKEQAIEVTGIEELQDFLTSCEPGTIITIIVEDEDE